MKKNSKLFPRCELIFYFAYSKPIMQDKFLVRLGFLSPKVSKDGKVTL